MTVLVMWREKRKPQRPPHWEGYMSGTENVDDLIMDDVDTEQVQADDNTQQQDDGTQQAQQDDGTQQLQGEEEDP